MERSRAVINRCDQVSAGESAIPPPRPSGVAQPPVAITAPGGAGRSRRRAVAQHPVSDAAADGCRRPGVTEVPQGAHRMLADQVEVANQGSSQWRCRNGYAVLGQATRRQAFAELYAVPATSRPDCNASGASVLAAGATEISNSTIGARPPLGSSQGLAPAASAPRRGWHHISAQPVGAEQGRR